MDTARLFSSGRFLACVPLLLAALGCSPPAGTPDGGGGCGAIAEPCCANNACISDFVCQSGACVAACGGSGQACCQGSACSAGLWGSGPNDVWAVGVVTALNNPGANSGVVLHWGPPSAG